LQLHANAMIIEEAMEEQQILANDVQNYTAIDVQEYDFDLRGEEFQW
jgi:hypothetical protein